MQLFNHLFVLYCTFYDELSSYQAADNHVPHVYQINFALCHLNLIKNATQLSIRTVLKINFIYAKNNCIHISFYTNMFFTYNISINLLISQIYFANVLTDIVFSNF